MRSSLVGFVSGGVLIWASTKDSSGDLWINLDGYSSLWLSPSLSSSLSLSHSVRKEIRVISTAQLIYRIIILSFLPKRELMKTGKRAFHLHCLIITVQIWRRGVLFIHRHQGRLQLVQQSGGELITRAKLRGSWASWIAYNHGRLIRCEIDYIWSWFFTLCFIDALIFLFRWKLLGAGKGFLFEICCAFT